MVIGTCEIHAGRPVDNLISRFIKASNKSKKPGRLWPTGLSWQAVPVPIKFAAELLSEQQPDCPIALPRIDLKKQDCGGIAVRPKQFRA
jgi:hypothetical protein